MAQEQQFADPLPKALNSFLLKYIWLEFLTLVTEKALTNPGPQILNSTN